MKMQVEHANAISDKNNVDTQAAFQKSLADSLDIW